MNKKIETRLMDFPDFFRSLMEAHSKIKEIEVLQINKSLINNKNSIELNQAKSELESIKIKLMKAGISPSEIRRHLP